ncbi:MAG: B12-binding domain-containing protein [Solirubrobacteraceae bacterium]
MVTSALGTGTRSWTLALQLAFVAGDLGHAVRIVRDAREQLDPLELLDEVVAPAMHHVGDLWEREMISVADEHLATSTAHRLLAEIAPSLKRPVAAAQGTVAVLAAPESERHVTALLMAESVLRGAGYRVKNLGPGVPLPSLQRMLQDDPPHLVGLTASIATPAELQEAIDGVRAASPDARVLVGGRHAAAVTSAEPVADLRGLATALEL